MLGLKFNHVNKRGHMCLNANLKWEMPVTERNLGLYPANERRRYNVTPSLIGWAQTENHPCAMVQCPVARSPCTHWARRKFTSIPVPYFLTPVVCWFSLFLNARRGANRYTITHSVKSGSRCSPDHYQVFFGTGDLDGYPALAMYTTVGALALDPVWSAMHV